MAATYEERMAAIEAAQTRGRHEALGAAIERACAELPDGFNLHIVLECGAGWIEALYDPNGEAITIDDGDDFADRINAAIDAARKAQPTRGEA